MAFEIIDFHTHPFIEPIHNICSHQEFCHMSAEDTLEVFGALQISRICGSVISTSPFPDQWEKIRFNNDTALRLREMYGDFYIPGFHVHPGYPDESVAEIRRMHGLGVRLIGELVPYMDGWNDYGCEALSPILDEAGKHGMVVSFHTMGDESIDRMVSAHRDVVFVAAHPGEYGELMRHVARMKRYENYYLDLSGTGLFRYGMLRRVIDEVGVDRVLFGSDFPTCNPAMFLGGVLLDPLITDGEKEQIFAGNAKRLLFS
jgi:predicted TIM-barrel fold metal-dependent hydrolase